MRRFVQLSSVFVTLSFAMACATVPATPPTEEALKDKVAAKGASATYQRYKVELDGNAMCGQEVHVGGSSTEKAPARYYFNNASFEVNHLNTWAYYVGQGFRICGSSSLIVPTVLNVVGDPRDALVVLGGCSIPLLLCSIPFSLYADWDMDEATADYNKQLKQKIFAGQAAKSTTPVGPIPRTSETEPAAQTNEGQTTQPQTDTQGAAPFSY